VIVSAVLVAALAGLLVGSFLNVVAWRLPRGESLVSPGSACPACRTPIKPYDNVPVVSWLLLRGRCRHCREAISGRYPLVEAATAALYAAVVIGRHGALDVSLGLLLVTALVPITLVDLDLRLIPNAITLPASVAAIVAAAIIDVGYVPEQLIAGGAAGGFFLLAAVLYPRGMGMGDVKLAGMLGLYLGRAVAPAVLVALVAGVLVGGLIIARKGAAEGRKTAVPFGPFLALGAVVALFAGDALVDAYLSTF
jgi:leader peptidase (prepilin peptidase) / N-methyltransferase